MKDKKTIGTFRTFMGPMLSWGRLKGEMRLNELGTKFFFVNKQLQKKFHKHQNLVKIYMYYYNTQNSLVDSMRSSNSNRRLIFLLAEPSEVLTAESLVAIVGQLGKAL